MAQNLQLAALFCCGYLVSRLMVKAGAPERLVAGLFARRPTHAQLVVYLVAGTAALSFMIPNAVTVITVLPVVVLVRERLVERHPDLAGRLTTIIALAVIYGANVGGMGSITGTPANGVLVVYTALESVPDHGLLRFDRWLAWGLPLVIVMVVACSAVICASAGRQLARERLPALVDAPRPHPLEPVAWRVAGGFVVAAFVLSALAGDPDARAVAVAITLVLGVALVAGLFAGRVAGAPVLTVRDCYRGLPARGLAFVAAVVVVAVVLAALGLIDQVADRAVAILPEPLDSPRGFVVVAALTSFATELFGNTVIQLAMFETLGAAPAADVLVETMLVVTLSCTCAFMSPLATGVNGLVFGELRGTSLWRMLAIGAVMNCVGALVVGGWVFAVVR